MKRYWVIAPYDSTQIKIFKKVWEYDLKNGTIAVGWERLGNTTGMSRSELESKYEKVYGDIRGFTTFWRYLHDVSPGDIIIARQGRKKIIGTGTVEGKAYYDGDKGRKRVANMTEVFYSNFIDVKWDEKKIDFDKMVFATTTIYEIQEEKHNSLIKGVISEEEKEIVQKPEFILEKYLEEFIVSNFNKIFEGKLELLKDEEGKIISEQYPTEVGNIDILVKEKSSNSYIVMELKKGRESDVVVGQTLRYMGWVKKNLCKDDEDVKGLIICKDKDEKLEYALEMTRNIKIKFYRVDFKLFDK